MHRDRYSLYVVLLSAVVAIVFSLLVSVLLLDRSAKLAKLERKNSELRQCEFYRAMIDAYNNPPPTNPTAKSVELAYRRQFSALGCSKLLGTD